MIPTVNEVVDEIGALALLNVLEDDAWTDQLLSAKGHRLGSQQRESSIIQQLSAESELLRSPQVAESARTCQLF
jgi:hypothetical protein